MRKLFYVLLAAVVSVGLFAQEEYFEKSGSSLEDRSLGTLKIDGEVKTGILWEKVEDRKDEFDDQIEKDGKVSLHSKDDAGSGTGRFRINADYFKHTEVGVVGFKIRLQWDGFYSDSKAPGWEYAFGYGDFIDDQLTVSIGRLGGSPWGTGGPDMWRELEKIDNSTLGVGGMRVEYKPKLKFLPDWEKHQINVGFVFNGPEDTADSGMIREQTLIDMLQESVIGASYKHTDWFMIRGAFRFDSMLDAGADRTGSPNVFEGYKMVYRFEEYALQKLLPNLSIWALGFFHGIAAENPDLFFTQNWLTVEYAPKDLTVLVRFGLDANDVRNLFYVRPSVSYKFFDGLLEPEFRMSFAQDFGARLYEGSPFSYINFEPKIQLNFGSAYIAFVYFYQMEYKYTTAPPELQTQWINLRFCIKF